ncbi:MAG: DUF2290 domain-containing protein [Planctomycetes bacterium]|nr:DUF2290 domain-containing protein [Planctomycetota bacterium]
MTTLRDTRNQINKLVEALIEFGLSIDQNFPFERHAPAGLVEITFPASERISVAFKDASYVEIYKCLVAERAFLVRLLDGAIIQMMYIFKGEKLERHRLAFFPSPDLEEFQNNPEIYLQDEIYADIIAKNIVPFPFRFDFDTRKETHEELVHPKSHLTLGQYKNCRIPVTAPVTPFWFIDFILRNFYNTAFNRFTDSLPQFKNLFDDSVLPSERAIVHVSIPKTFK